MDDEDVSVGCRHWHGHKNAACAGDGRVTSQKEVASAPFSWRKLFLKEGSAAEEYVFAPGDGNLGNAFPLKLSGDGFCCVYGLRAF
ncbi:hypothetical protein MTO96_014526 [Rhipicephalus appendiculatus]